MLVVEVHRGQLELLVGQQVPEHKDREIRERERERERERGGGGGGGYAGTSLLDAQTQILAKPGLLGILERG